MTQLSQDSGDLKPQAAKGPRIDPALPWQRRQGGMRQRFGSFHVPYRSVQRGLSRRRRTICAPGIALLALFRSRWYMLQLALLNHEVFVHRRRRY